MAYSLGHKIPRDTLTAFCKRNHIRRLSVFGSCARGESRPDSDVDLLVEFEQDHTPGLFAIVKMEMELAGMLDRKVDLRTAEDLSRYFRDEVVQNAQLQYPA